MTPALVILIGVAIAMRAFGAAVRHPDHLAVIRISGWLMCAGGVWVAAAAAGAYSPAWPVMAAGLVIGLLHLRWPTPNLTVGTDGLIVVLAGVIAVPRVDVITILVAALSVIAAGIVIDRVVVLLGRNVRLAALGVQCAAVVPIALVVPRFLPSMPVFAWHTASPLAAFNVGVTATSPGQRVDLKPTAAVGWLEQPRRSGRPSPAAIVFHGAHRDGSQQPAANVLRRALLDAGFVVLSVDRSGFGASPAPPADASIDDWDPLPVARSAVAAAREAIDGDFVIAVGHSMGCTDVLRLLVDGAEIDLAILFGGAIAIGERGPEEALESKRRFHDLRRLPYMMDADDVLAINDRYFDNVRFAKALPIDHPPVVFVRFGIEHDDLLVGRDLLHNMIPGKTIHWDFDGATHYFNAWRRAGLLVGDTRIARTLGNEFRRMRQQLLTEDVEPSN